MFLARGPKANAWIVCGGPGCGRDSDCMQLRDIFGVNDTIGNVLNRSKRSCWLTGIEVVCALILGSDAPVMIVVCCPGLSLWFIDTEGSIRSQLRIH